MTDCGYFTLDLKQLGFCSSPVFLQTLDLDSRMKGTLYFHRKRGPWTTAKSPVLLLLGPVETLPTLAQVQNVAWPEEPDNCSPSPGCVWMWWFLKLWLPPHSTLSGSLQILESSLFDNPLKPTVISFAGAFSPATFCPSTRLSIDMLGHSTLWAASLLSYEFLWLTHPMEGINDGLLASCHVCSLPHIEPNWDNWTKLKQFNDTWGNLCRCFVISRWLVCDTQFKTFMPCKFGLISSQYSNFLNSCFRGFYELGSPNYVKINK